MNERAERREKAMNRQRVFISRHSICVYSSWSFVRLFFSQTKKINKKKSQKWAFNSLQMLKIKKKNHRQGHSIVAETEKRLKMHRKIWHAFLTAKPKIR